jgi:hypothetical protein
MNGAPLIIIALRFTHNVKAKLMNGAPLIIIALRFTYNVKAKLMNGATFAELMPGKSKLTPGLPPKSPNSGGL